jgi:hypothetical protein
MQIWRSFLDVQVDSPQWNHSVFQGCLGGDQTGRTMLPKEIVGINYQSKQNHFAIQLYAALSM